MNIGLFDAWFIGSIHKTRPGRKIFYLVYDGDLVDRDISDPFILVPQIQNSSLDVNYVAAKGGICPARDVDLFAQKLFQKFFH